MSDRPDNLHSDIPVSPEGHFYLHFYALLARVLINLNYLAEQGGERLELLPKNYPFLDDYKKMLEGYAGLPLDAQQAWWANQITILERAYPRHLPLRTLKTSLELSDAQINLLLVAGMVEENISFGAIFAYLQEPLPARLPGLGILGVLLGDLGTPLQDTWDVCRPLINHNLLYVQNPNDPRVEWLVRVPIAVWDGLRGRPLVKPMPDVTIQPMRNFPDVDDLILPLAITDQVSRLPMLLTNKQVNTVIVRGLRGTGRRTLIGSLARSMERGVLLCEVLTDDTRKLIGPLATLTNTVPILRLNPAPGETIDLPSLAGYRGVVGVTLGKSGGLRGELVKQAFNITLPAPDRNARARLWTATAAPLAEGSSDEVIERFLVTAGLIYQAAGLAKTYAQLDSRSMLGVSDVQQALRALNRQTLDTLATPLEAVSGWSDLVMNHSVLDELNALELRCRIREDLRSKVGPAFEKTLNRGVRAMFSGTSGTGKTLAARALAAELQMDLYRIDLAAVVNKYIGETERNLNEVLSRAEELDVLLLLDEGDALMARRTEVSNANDRYANLETNYLLQRLESYEGIVIITTNAAQRIDSAFMRRLDVVIDFSKPNKNERLQLWNKHLPRYNSITKDFLDRVATRCELSGGQIRNAALQFALIANETGHAADDTALEEAIQNEYRKGGLAYPLKDAPKERLQLWNDYLPQDHHITPDFLDRVALVCELSPAQIHSVALQFVQIASVPGRTTDNSALAEALQQEYRKVGLMYPLKDQDGTASSKTSQRERLRDMLAKMN